MEIPNIGFGTYRLRDHTTDAVIHALHSGYTHIDTAPLYKNEDLVGSAINRSGVDRRKIFITTKISRKELKENRIQESIEHSLTTMGQDYLDLVLLHEHIDPVTNWELLCEYHSTIGKNKVRYIGVSNFRRNDLEKMTEKKPPYCNQIEMNPFLQRDDVVEYCTQNTIRVVAHSPLAKGEKLDNHSLNNIAETNNRTPAQIMLGWNTQQNHIVIPRSKNIQHIEENLGLGFEIPQNDMEQLNTLHCNYSTHPKYLL